MWRLVSRISRGIRWRKPRNHLKSSVKYDWRKIYAGGITSVALFALSIPQIVHAEKSKEMTRYTVADAVEICGPSVVNISINTRFISSAGSGFVYNSHKRLIATNFHVVKAALDGGSLTVTFPDGEEVPAALHSFDEPTDIALIQLRHLPRAPLTQAQMGESASLRAGEWVAALGSPLTLSKSVTAGIVSSVDRQASELGMGERRTDYIQTDAAINSGNSGGPLINMDGEVIGINTMKIQGAGGIGLAIPADTAKLVLDQLAKNQEVVRPYLGFRMAKRGDGVFVVDVAKGSPAERAGLHRSDQVLSIDNRIISKPYDIIKAIGYERSHKHEFKVRRRNGVVDILYMTPS